jgi:hypothetical protein
MKMIKNKMIFNKIYNIKVINNKAFFIKHKINQI